MRRFPRSVLLTCALVAVHRGDASDYFVDPSDANGAFTTIQDAVDAVRGQTELNRANIFIAPGTYREAVVVTQPFISFIGTGDTPSDVRIMLARTSTSSGGDFDWGQVVWVQPSATAFMARNLTFENSLPDDHRALGVALQSSADRAIYDNVRVISYQDTLLADFGSRQYFRGSLISGDTDFIYGDATAVFGGCTIASTDFGYIAAPDTARATAIGFVFLDCALTAESDRGLPGGDDSSPDDGTVYLARPWMWFEPDVMPSATFIRTRMGTQIAPAGWDPWNDTGVAGVDPNTDRDRGTRFAEFGSMNLSGEPLRDADGDGKPDGRAPWADVMTAEQAANYTLDRIFGPADFWNANTQPGAPATPYESQGPAWDAKGQLALLPERSGPPSRPLNLSTRLRTETGDNVAIAGFVLRGSAPKSLLVRGLGPSLNAEGVVDAVPNPVVALRDAAGALVRSNDDWKYTQEAQIAATGLAPASDLEAAVVATLAPGAYTAIVNGNHGATGVTLAEIYDIDTSNSTELANISTRGMVGAGDDVMIAGFILGGGEGTAKVLIRGIGPSLAKAGIAQPLADPALTLHDSDGAVIAVNNDWQESQPVEVRATGIPPRDTRESAIVATLPPGSYTAVLSSSGPGTPGGVGMVEVYALQ